jgi:hypothetical protein
MAVAIANAAFTCIRAEPLQARRKINQGRLDNVTMTYVGLVCHEVTTVDELFCIQIIWHWAY